MAGQMDEQYFDEKKGLALEAISGVNKDVAEVTSLIAATNYAMSDLVDPRLVHELLKSAAGRLDAARRDFEKARWAAARTDLEFEQWLSAHGHGDLRYTQD